MQVFDSIINETKFSFIRVPYGKGDLWYHITYPKGEKLVTFRMCKEVSDSWKMHDVKDNWLYNFSTDFNLLLNTFESSLAESNKDLKIEQF